MGRVDGHVGRAGLEHAQQANDHFQAALGTDGHALIGLHAQFKQLPGQVVGAAVELTIAQLTVFADQRHGIGVGLHLGFEQLVDRLRRAKIAGGAVEVFEQQLAFAGRHHVEAAGEAVRGLLQGVHQGGHGLAQVGGDALRIDAGDGLGRQGEAVRHIRHGDFDGVVGAGFRGDEVHAFVLAHVLDVFSRGVHQIAVTAVEDHREQRQRSVHRAATLGQGQGGLFVGQQLAQLLVGVMDDVADGVLLQADAHRQGVDEHPQCMVGTGSALGTT
ncbi:hypothetical protein SRABI112_03793 [Pseudomonas mediterranea]|nr:hypothetical protein SRABI112_03793 [Pseudomonas mediterranea]